MATHPSVLAWRIPGTGEPGGLPSLGSHRVGHDWSNLAAVAAAAALLICRLPRWLSGSVCNAGDAGDMDSIPGLGRSPGEGHGNPLRYSCLENPMDREAWRATVPGVTKSRTQASDWAQTHKQGARIQEAWLLTLPWSSDWWYLGWRFSESKIQESLIW